MWTHRIFLALVTLVVMMATCWPNAVSAELYSCRDRSGGMTITNVRNDPSCVPYTATKKVPKKKKQRWLISRSATGGAPTSFDRDIHRIARRYSIDPLLIKAIIHTESNFDHKAVSRSGAQGLMQLMPATARELRVANPFNPRQNIDGGTRYFRQILNDFNGNLVLSLAAYNAGPGLVRRTGGVPQIPETRRYVYKVLRQYRKYKRAG